MIQASTQVNLLRRRVCEPGAVRFSEMPVSLR